MLKAFIVDDEPLARDELSYLLRRSKKVEIVGEAESMETALANIRDLKPDVVFVDIQLAEGNGMDLAGRLAERDGGRPDIVFATAYDEYALKAFELNAVDYLLKPYDERRILQTVEKVARRHEYRESREAFPFRRKAAAPEKIEKLAITVEDRILLIHTGKIMYISSEEGKTVIATEDKQYKVNEPLMNFEQKLANASFARVHRAYLVNLDYIVEIQPWFHSTYNLIMKDGRSVPVSRTYLKELKQRIGF